MRETDEAPQESLYRQELVLFQANLKRRQNSPPLSLWLSATQHFPQNIKQVRSTAF